MKKEEMFKKVSMMFYREYQKILFLSLLTSIVGYETLRFKWGSSS